MFAMTVAQALIALEHHGRAAIGWAVGVVFFVAGVALTSGLLRRVEIGYVVGTGVAALVMVALVIGPLRSPEADVEEDALVDAVAQEPIEL
jgi:hypothetical protein